MPPVSETQIKDLRQAAIIVAEDDPDLLKIYSQVINRLNDSKDPTKIESLSEYFQNIQAARKKAQQDQVG